MLGEDFGNLEGRVALLLGLGDGSLREAGLSELKIPWRVASLQIACRYDTNISPSVHLLPRLSLRSLIPSVYYTYELLYIIFERLNGLSLLSDSVLISRLLVAIRLQASDLAQLLTNLVASPSAYR